MRGNESSRGGMIPGRDQQPATAGALFSACRLQAAVNAAGEAVRKQPANAGSRLLLAEMLLFADELERVDAVLRRIDAIHPDAALAVAAFRQLLRAETTRRHVLRQGWPPGFVGSPTVAQAHLLQALAAMRAGDLADATASAEAAEASRPPTSGATPEATFDDFRDADDLWAGTFEVLTTTGKYFWIPTERIASLEPHPPMRPRDLFWRRCTMSVRNGPDGDVYLPALYLMPHKASDALRIGRLTTWTDDPPIRGTGQRMFLIGDNGVPVQQLPALFFAQHSSDSAIATEPTS